MNLEMLEVIADSDLADVAGGLSLGLSLESKVASATVSASTNDGINLNACLSALGLVNVGLTTSVG